MIITVEHLYGTSREIADRARTTIGLDEGTKEVSEKYMRKLYLCEHSPIRTQMYRIKFDGIPYWIAMHFCRHKNGAEHFVSTQRDDRAIDTSIPRDKKGQGELVKYEIVLNSQAIINISRKRLCSCADVKTRIAWKRALTELEKINPTLVNACVPDCVYRGHCYEHKTCGFHKSDIFKDMVEFYREGINE